MKTSRIVFACLIVTFLANCDSGTPTESVDPAITDVEFAVIYNEKDVPWSQWLTVPVCGDDIFIEILDHWVYWYTETPNGRELSGFRTNYSGTATGSPSGRTWKLNGQYWSKVSSDDDGAPTVGSYHDVIVMVGKGSAPNIRSSVYYKVTVNANGEPVVDRWFFNPMCQGS